MTASLESHARSQSVLALFIAAWVALGAPASAEAQSRAQPAATYASLAQLPDWSGWWGLDEPIPEEWARQPPPIKPGLFEARQAARLQDSESDALRFCRPPQFTGYSGGFVDAVELLFTPGRVTLTTEGGLIRRIYTDGRPMPEDLADTNTGTSIGRWEGQTLVVETAGINPHAQYPNSSQGSAPIGKGVRITERISLQDANTLQFDIVTIAPDVLAEPDRRTRLYRRLPATMHSEITFCTEYDRSIDPVSGKQRFDLTPPADLPPPPSR